MMIFVRLVGGALGIVVALSMVDVTKPVFDIETTTGVVLLLVWLAAWFVIGFSIMPYITVEPAGWLVRSVVDLSTGEFISAVVGLVVGLVIGLLLGLPLSNLPPPLGLLLPIGTSVVLGLGMMGLTVAKRRDIAQAIRQTGLLPAQRERDAAVGGGGQAGPTIYVDTSAIIDGRIADVVASGFLWGTLIVPRFVVDELQAIADHRDASRRSRGRRGLEILALLQKDPRISVELVDEDARELDKVDAKLVELARRRTAAVLTNDYNLNRVAQLHDVRVLNLNHLANALKPAFLPGDGMRVKVIQQGKEPGQGLAYLDDGTMIVVEGGGSLMEREVEVTVTRVLQTVAGRMVFAQPRAES
ncbi:MAG TPA: PIN domain-containing protein [Candidatus Limnocylindria bacterium]|nr:PIN domain-containing protein [Candidatus Limnocylindria bacterium]